MGSDFAVQSVAGKVIGALGSQEVRRKPVCHRDSMQSANL